MLLASVEGVEPSRLKGVRRERRGFQKRALIVVVEGVHHPLLSPLFILRMSLHGPSTVLLFLASFLLLAIIAAPSGSVKGVPRRGHSAALQRAEVVRRAKRSVVSFAEPEEETEGEEEDELLQSELSQLTDQELGLLARIVQNEIDKYDPQVPLQNYEIVEIPDEYLIPAGYPARVRRSMPVQEVDDAEIVFVPEELLVEDEDDLDDQQRDEEELRQRIAIIADALNERTQRGRPFRE